MQPEKKAIWGWALYDWANSAFATTVMAGFFPVFFKQYWSHGADVNLSTAQLGFGNAAAGLAMYLGALATAALYLVGQGQWAWAIFCYALGIVGFSGANVFYDALLPSVAPPARIDTVSSLGYALGYLGGGLLFLLNVVMTLWPQAFGLADSAAAVRLSFISVAIWWGVFTVFTILWVPEPRTAAPLGLLPAARAGIRQLRATFRKIRRFKPALSLGFSSHDLIAALLVVQFVGFPAAIGFGRLGRRWGPRRAIFLAIGVYMGVTVWGAMMTNRLEFYVMAVIIGLVQGGIQALSRSYYARLIPAEHPAEFFGFYNMLGKFASILGPALMGTVGLVVRQALMPEAPDAAQLTRIGQIASRAGILSLLVLFALGAILLWRVKDGAAMRPEDQPPGR